MNKTNVHIPFSTNLLKAKLRGLLMLKEKIFKKIVFRFTIVPLKDPFLFPFFLLYFSYKLF